MASATKKITSKESKQVSGKAKWTFMVFMAGDNNLDGAALRDITEMAQAGSTAEVNIIAQLDRAGATPTRRFKITKGGGYKKDVIAELGETNTGDPAVLADFLKWAVKDYPAEHYFLVLWNHGSGWWEDERKKKGIAYDDTDNDYLNNVELTSVLETFMQATGEKVDILGMDACLMTMVEVAYQLQDTVQFIVGSEIEEPFEGWPYHTILKYLTQHPKVTPSVLAVETAKLYVKSYANTTEDVTQSVIATAKLDPITLKLNELVKLLLDPALAKAAQSAVAAAWRVTPKFYNNMYLDLYRFAANLQKKAIGEVRLKAGELLKTLVVSAKNSVIYSGKHGKFAKDMKGLAIYFPPANVNTAYYDLHFSGDCQWAEYLKTYCNQ